MKIFFHFSVAGFSNSYLLGPDHGGDAIVVDPGVMNTALLDLIESHRYYVRHVLITHTHPSHIHGLKTLLRIYEAKIVANTDRIYSFECQHATGGDVLDCSGIRVDVIAIPGHSRDSVVYRIGRFLFTGDVMGAGHIGSTPNGYAKELMIRAYVNGYFRWMETC